MIKMFQTKNPDLLAILSCLDRVNQKLLEHYNGGCIEYTDYARYKVYISYLYLGYNKLTAIDSTKNIPLMQKPNLGEENRNPNQIISNARREVEMLLKTLEMKRFDLIEDACSKMEQKEVEVKCFSCNKREVYRGQGIVIKKYEEHHVFPIIGEWVCSEECNQQL